MVGVNLQLVCFLLWSQNGLSGKRFDIYVKAGKLTEQDFKTSPKILAGEFHAKGIKNIRIAAIAPGYVETPLLTSIKPEILQSIINEIPPGRLVKTDEIVSTIKFIIENESVHGTTLEVSGGIIGKGLAK